MAFGHHLLECPASLKCIEIRLMEWPHTLPPFALYTCIQYTDSHREEGMGGGGGELTRKKVRERRNSSQWRSKIPT